MGIVNEPEQQPVKKLNAKIISGYQEKIKKAKTIGDFKKLGNELKDAFGLTDIEAIDILNGRNVLEILTKYE